MTISKKIKLIAIVLIFLGMGGVFLYFKYFFTYEQKNILKRKVEAITGSNLTITIFSYNGTIIKRWDHIKKITSAKENRNYTYFYTKDNRYVQIPNSVLYIAEEQ